MHVLVIGGPVDAQPPRVVPSTQTKVDPKQRPQSVGAHVAEEVETEAGDSRRCCWVALEQGMLQRVHRLCLSIRAGNFAFAELELVHITLRRGRALGLLHERAPAHGRGRVVGLQQGSEGVAHTLLLERQHSP